MSSTDPIDLPTGARDASRTPHVVWDTPGVSVQGWSGYTAYALDVSVSSSLEHHFVGPDVVLSRLDDLLKTAANSTTSVHVLPAGPGGVAGCCAYELRCAQSAPMFVLARTEIQESDEPVTRLRVVLWRQTAGSKMPVSGAAGLAVDYAKLTWRQLEPKALITDIAGAFGSTALAVDGASTASIVAASKGQSLSVIVQSRFVWWFAAFAMVIGSMFFSVIVLFGDLSLSSLLELGAMFAVGVWGLITTRRNWRRRKGR